MNINFEFDEQIFSAFKTFVFKVCAVSDSNVIKDSILRGLQTEIADVNRPRILATVNKLSRILKEVVAQMSPVDDNFSKTSFESGADVISHTDERSSITSVVKINEAEENDEIIDIPTDFRNVQITANKTEIDRRIAAFLEKQRMKVNFDNIKEFCGVSHDQDNSCARDAVFVPRKGSRSHIIVKRVVNRSGPQTSSHMTAAVQMCGTSVFMPDTDSKKSDAVASERKGVLERLHAIEANLKLKHDQTTPRDLYERLELLESKILDLESFSPEYFNTAAYPDHNKRPKLSSNAISQQNNSLSSVDQRMEYLRHKLKQKVSSERH